VIGYLITGKLSGWEVSAARFDRSVLVDAESMGIELCYCKRRMPKKKASLIREWHS
jgi:hypothetical protein